MAMDPLTTPPFPDVPDEPGVPPVWRETGATPDQVDLSGGVGAQGSPPEQLWGLFNAAGRQVLTPDSIISISYRNDSRISDYPQEQGAFSSYNKVATPFDIHLVVAKGKTENDRKLFLDEIEKARLSLELFYLITPEVTISGVSVVHASYSRNHSHGANMLSIDIGLREVRVSGAQAFTSTKGASAAKPINNGSVQAKPLTKEEQAAFDASAQDLEAFLYADFIAVHP